MFVIAVPGPLTFFNFLATNLQRLPNGCQIVEDLIQSLIQEGKLSDQLPNSLIYEQLSSHIDVSASYLDPEPCNICTNPDQVFTEIALSDYRSNSKYTHDSINIQLSKPLIFSKITLNFSVKKSSRLPKSIILFVSTATFEDPNLLLTDKPKWRIVGSIYFPENTYTGSLNLSLPSYATCLRFFFDDFWEDPVELSQLTCPMCHSPIPDLRSGICPKDHENAINVAIAVTLTITTLMLLYAVSVDSPTLFQ